MKSDAIKDGILPKRGMWLVSPGRKRAYGKIRYVRQNTIVWENISGLLISTEHETIHTGDYTYLQKTDGPPNGYRQEGIMSMKLKKPKPGNGQCDAMRCKEAPKQIHQHPDDGTVVELCQIHSLKFRDENPSWDVFEATPISETNSSAEAPSEVISANSEAGEAEEIVRVSEDMISRMSSSPWVAELSSEAKKLTDDLKALEGFEISSQDEFSFVEKALQEIQKRWDEIEKRRASFSKPANRVVRAFNGFFAPALTALKHLENTAKKKLSAYRMAAIAEQQRLKDLARQQEAPGAIQQTLIAADTIVPQASTTQYVNKWRFEITDASLLPREFLCPDLGTIKKTVEYLKDKTSIPGVRVWNEPQVRGSRK